MEIINKIATVVSQKRIRIHEFFRDFDVLRKGIVSDAIFTRVLNSSLNITIPEEALQQIKQMYRSAENQIDYARFCKDILEKEQLSGNAGDNEDKFPEAIEFVRQMVREKRVLIKPVFADFDRTKSGYVTKAQFARVLTTVSLCPPEQILEMLMKHYAKIDNPLLVQYVTFCNDVEHADALNISYKGETATIKASKIPPSLTAPRFLDHDFNQPVDPKEISQKIQAICVERRIRINEFFRDFDKLRKYTVSIEIFKRVMGQMGIQLSPQEFLTLSELYKTPEGEFHYGNFCGDVDLAFTTPGIDKAPDVKVEPVTAEKTLAARRKFLEQDSQVFEQILPDYQRLIQIRRVPLKAAFQDFDPTRCGHISRLQFTRVLNQLQVMPNEQILNVFLRRYLDKGNLEEVNYVDFVTDVDIPEDSFHPKHQNPVPISIQNINEIAQNQKHRQVATISNARPENLEDVLSRIRLEAFQRSIRLLEFLRDFDRLRSGIITCSQFRIGLNMAKIVLSEAEFETLTQEFSAGQGRIFYRKLCDTIDEIFMIKGLEKDPQKDQTFISTQTNYGFQPPNETEQVLGRVVIDRFHDFAIQFCLDVKSQFKDWDRHNYHKITPKTFRQVLASFKFYLNEEEFQSLVKMYQNKEGMVQYLDFLNDTRLKTVQEEANEQAMLQQTFSQKVKVQPKDILTPYKMFINEESDADKLLQKIQHQVKQRRLRPMEFFSEHDQLRKGYISKAKFRSALDNLKQVFHLDYVLKTPSYNFLKLDSSIHLAKILLIIRHSTKFAKKFSLQKALIKILRQRCRNFSLLHIQILKMFYLVKKKKKSIIAYQDLES